MGNAKKDFVNGLIDKMTIEQKVGQCLVIGFVGTIITPEILKRIRNYYPAGIRAGLTFRVKTAVHDPYAYNPDFLDRVIRHPRDTVKDYIPGYPVPHCTNEEYCEFLNTLKREALNNGLGVPLHITLDMEGDTSCDYVRGGIRTFPAALGVAKTGDEKLVYDMAWATARQVRALGFNWIHGPVLDVNSEPMNPEIGPRAYGETTAETIPNAIQAFKGFRDGGLITTGKHYPGRGASADDAHAGLPIINLSKDEMDQHLQPFKALVDQGIPCIMTAHTVYPALDPDEPATMSKIILTDILKKGMGFQGCITADDITMGGIVAKYEVAQACIKSLNAGVDLILLRDEGPLIDEVYADIVQAAQQGRLSEERLDDALKRSLTVKCDYGLFENGNIQDVNQASAGINDRRVAEIATRVAEQTLTVMCDNDNLLPLSRNEKVLLIEQINPLHLMINSQRCHPGILWENMMKYNAQVGMVETELSYTDDDKERIYHRLDHYDTIVFTNYFERRTHYDPIVNDTIKDIVGKGKKVIVVTNSPYPFTVQDEFGTVINTFSSSVDSLEAAAKTIFGLK